MILIGSGCTDTGRLRPNNEDCFAVDDALSLFLVADGMGGHAAGEVASRTAVDTVHQEVRRLVHSPAGRREPFRADAVLNTAFLRANAVIQESADGDPDRRGMGTTLTALWCPGDQLVLAHVGDSRAYMLRKTELLQLTRDHRLMAEIGASDEEERRSPLAHVLTRALGPHSEIEVDTGRVHLQDGDRLLVCSDGLYSELTDEGIVSLLHASGGPGAACRSLVGTANRMGGRDNITAVVVHVYAGMHPLSPRRLWHRISNRIRLRSADG